MFTVSSAIDSRAVVECCENSEVVSCETAGFFNEYVFRVDSRSDEKVLSLEGDGEINPLSDGAVRRGFSVACVESSHEGTVLSGSTFLELPTKSRA